jgi:hypothetical protein
MGNIFGDILRPPFRRVEADNPHGIVLLSVEKVGMTVSICVRRRLSMSV